MEVQLWHYHLSLICEAETATAKFKMYKTPDTDQIPAELCQTRRNILRSEIHKLINSI
jgi:hypothetical protein